jgi:hypothetical protein
MKNILSALCTAAYRVGVLALLLLLLAGLARTNQILFSIGSMLFKVVGGATT